MKMDEALNALCAGVQGLLSGADLDLREEEGYSGKVLRIPREECNSHDGFAVQVNCEEEPGTMIFRLVPYPVEPESDVRAD